ncbi:MAG TPA: zf-HC2 domain-containing protein [Trebonia sp.]|jgi:anti-sigma factor RsiW|nr:zf-HC2 domain-containing protein [Trebonia sp.]
MTHLGTHLSALVDGELSGTDLDRANAHLATCEKCRGEAAALRELKTQLRVLVADIGDDALTSRLLAMPDEDSHPSGPPRPRPAFRAYSYQEAPDRPPRAGREARRPPRSPRHRYFVWSAVSLAVVGGLGAAAFGMGGGNPGPGPDVIPPAEVFNVEHAITTGDVPLPETSRVPKTKTPGTAYPSDTARRAAQRQP